MFKFVSIFATILTVAHFLSIPSKNDYNWMEEQIVDALEVSRNNTPDPWIFEDIEADLVFPGITVGLGMSDTILNGSAGFEIEKVSFDLDTWQADVIMNYPQLNSSGTNYGRITIGDKSLNLFLDITQNVQIYDYLYEFQYKVINGTDNKLLVKDWWGKITIGSMDYQMSIKLNGIELGYEISHLINAYGAKFINDNHKIISYVSSAIIQFIIDIIQK